MRRRVKPQRRRLRRPRPYGPHRQLRRDRGGRCDDDRPAAGRRPALAQRGAAHLGHALHRAPAGDSADPGRFLALMSARPAAHPRLSSPHRFRRPRGLRGDPRRGLAARRRRFIRNARRGHRAQDQGTQSTPPRPRTSRPSFGRRAAASTFPQSCQRRTWRSCTVSAVSDSGCPRDKPPSASTATGHVTSRHGQCVPDPDLVIGVYNAAVSSGGDRRRGQDGLLLVERPFTSGRLFRKSDGTLVLFSGF